MRTRIRHFRKQRGLTQTELASRLGTTAATVSRLETADMTVSTGWLERIAGELDVPVTDLLDQPGQGALACIGELRRGGVVAFAEPPSLPPSLLSLARDPMVFRVGETLGSYARGDVLVADCLPFGEAEGAIGRDCFAGGGEGGLSFGRLVSLALGNCVLMPPEEGTPPREVRAPEWIAPVVTLLRNYPPVRTAAARSSGFRMHSGR